MNLVPPSNPSQIIRKVDLEFSSKLEERFKESITLMDPLICLVVGVESAHQFDDDQITEYKYETLGGNHRRVALQSLISKELLDKDVTVPVRLCFGICSCQ